MVRASLMVDRAARRFDELRALLVLAFASDQFLDDYGRDTYNRTSKYNATSESFREELFPWEREVVARFFPAPPASILIGGAGGGREPFALAAMGYRVTAFDPADDLAASMQRRAHRDFPDQVEVTAGGYEDLPMLPRIGGAGRLDLSIRPRFAAAILGWSSFSHLRNDPDRTKALSAVAALTDGPILLSFYAEKGQAAPHSGSTLLSWLRRRSRRRGQALFAPAVGFVRVFADGEVQALAHSAGLVTRHFDRESGWPHAVVMHPSRAAAPAAGAAVTLHEA